MRIEDEINQQTFIHEHQKLLINVLYTSNWMSGIITETLRLYGITPQQYNVLRILRGQHPNSCTITTVRDRMLDKMSDASRIIERLRKKGFLIRRKGQKDKRTADVLISNEGLELLNKIENKTESFYEKLKGLSEKEAIQLNTLLDKLRS